ncbi:MAG: hypothetical protein HC897_14415 [Thermoanaerobaculia bacterium]|nr:hypothetical protein [Thermoanaerobaculia bacterium]
MRYPLICFLLVAVIGAQPARAQTETVMMVECFDEASGCGDVFGDLVHVLRDTATGQPILAQRWVELPASEPGYGWGYCPIAVAAGGQEIGFLPYTCDPADPSVVKEVDYFGRLSAGRTKERNNRMHFDEVISTLQSSDHVTADEAGRLKIGFDCSARYGEVECDDWKTIDSPMESLALYTRLMKYGHLQTDPLEEDVWSHGDPSLPTQYHPALSEADWLKFAPEVRHLLPGDGTFACFPPAGPNPGFDPRCAQPEPLLERDLVRSAAFLAGAADKTGEITADLVQYLNRILKIPEATETTAATLARVPALVRDCWDGADRPTPTRTTPTHPTRPTNRRQTARSSPPTPRCRATRSFLSCRSSSSTSRPRATSAASGRPTASPSSSRSAPCAGASSPPSTSRRGWGVATARISSPSTSAAL